MRRKHWWGQIVFGMVLAAQVAGCADWKAHQSLEKSKYLGKKIDDLYDEYGVPVGMARKSDGGYFVEFESYRNGFQCTADVTADSSGRIIKIRTGGQNGCILPAWAR